MGMIISQRAKQEYASAIDDVFNNFCRNITIINEVANATIINDPNYNAFSDRETTDVLYSANTQIIPAVIKYIDKADSETELLFKGVHDSGGGGAVSAYMRQEYGLIRIKVKLCHKELVKEATKVIVDDQDCQLIYNFTAKMLFNLNYVIFYLARQV